MNVKSFAKWTGLWFLVGVIALYALLYALTSFNDGEFKQRLMELPLLIQVHAIGGAIALVLGLVQFQRVRKRIPARGHRYIGRTYAFAVLASSVAGMLMAVRSDAGIMAQLGFAGLAMAWFTTLGMAWIAIRERDQAKHQYYIWLNYALTWAAVTLRLELPLLVFGFGVELGYTIVAWSCWVPNILFAFWWARQTQPAAVKQ
jgi:uncharacterized membrane protein